MEENRSSRNKKRCGNEKWIKNGKNIWKTQGECKESEEKAGLKHVGFITHNSNKKKKI